MYPYTKIKGIFSDELEYLDTYRRQLIGQQRHTDYTYIITLVPHLQR